jgi:outer membrane protein assembly factor BamB
LIFATAKTRVMALNRQTGQLAWEATLSDELPSRCSNNDCLRVVGQRVVVLAGDGGLVGLDAQSGRTVWNTRLNSTPDRLHVINDQIVLFDQRDGGVVLSIINPTDGSERQTLKPICSGSSSSMTDDARLDSPVLVDSDQKSLYILFGFFNTCVQRWDATTGELIWNASFEDISFFSGHGPQPILIDDALYVASENQLVAVNRADGAWRTLIDDPDYEFVPLAVQDGVLIVRAKRTRGTTRFELWGVNSEAGERVWQHVFTDSEPLDEPDRMSGLIDEGDSGWTAHLTPQGLVVVQAMAQPHHLSIETLDPASGVSSGAMTIPLAGISGGFYSVPDVVGWKSSTLWMIVEGRLYVLDLATSTWALTWP